MQWGDKLGSWAEARPRAHAEELDFTLKVMIDLQFWKTTSDLENGSEGLRLTRVQSGEGQY